MPNHCSNSVVVSRRAGSNNPSLSPATVINNHVTTQVRNTDGQTNYQDGEFNFATIIPEPDWSNRGDEWYQWRISNWGTKWNAYNTDINDAGDIGEMETTVINFDTAWSPPIGIMIAWSKMYPDFLFDWECDIEGEDHIFSTVIEDGEIVEERTEPRGNINEEDELTEEEEAAHLALMRASIMNKSEDESELDIDSLCKK